MKTLVASLCFFLFSPDLLAQNLLNERIREITTDKKSVFLQGGIFHGGRMENKSTLNSIRQSYTPGNGQERLVFDLSSDGLPKVYGHLNTEEKKLYLDFFSTDLVSGFSPLSSGKFIKAVDFFKITQDALTIEISFHKSVGIDVFYLSSPTRLVVDLKN